MFYSQFPFKDCSFSQAFTNGNWVNSHIFQPSFIFPLSFSTLTVRSLLDREHYALTVQSQPNTRKLLLGLNELWKTSSSLLIVKSNQLSLLKYHNPNLSAILY